ncbi:MAG: NHL repeat-containing protein [Treponematales bacterium]
MNIKFLYCLVILYTVIITSCDPAPDSEPPVIPTEKNGPLSDTQWCAFAYHKYLISSGENPDVEMDPSNTIFIHTDTTTLTGDFWGNYEGTYASYYSENNPDYVMPTSPRIFVRLSNSTSIQIIQGGHETYGTIVWVRASDSDGGRIDVYFRSQDKNEEQDDDDDNTLLDGQWTTSSLAGTTTAGYADGTRTAARFSSPQSIAVDNDGNIYVADTGNNRIRKITSAGVVSTIAGSSTAGYGDGTGTAAWFSAPQGIALDASGNIYVADTGNNRIRKITSERVVTSLAGTTSAGYAEGTGTAVRFSAPQGIAVDASGNIYVADTGNNRIRKITSSGVVSTIAGSRTAGYGDGTGTAAWFSAPQGIALDASGNIYVADTGNNRIRKITPERVVTSLAGTTSAGYAEGTGTAVRFSAPQGIVIDNAGAIYVSDTNNNRIRKIMYE